MTELVFDHEFDSSRMRHYLNGQTTVLHCHHYMTLFSQLALDADELVGSVDIFKKSSEDVFYELLTNYYDTNEINSTQDRLSIAVAMYSAMGLGKMEIVTAQELGGEVELAHSHVDEGWIKKWGNNDGPVNFTSAGYIAAAFSAAFNKPTRSFTVNETQSIVTGADKSIFKIEI